MPIQVTRWYVWAKDRLTNEAISEAEGVSPEDFVGEKPCTDGVHPLWRINADMPDYLEKSRSGSRLDFQLYTQEGSDGEIVPWSASNPAPDAVPVGEETSSRHCPGCTECGLVTDSVDDGRGRE